jgi:putative intracellular protease/amidase
MNKHALIVVTSHDEMGDTGEKTGWYLSEVTHVYYPLIAAGFTVDFASPEGGEAPIDVKRSLNLDDPENKKFMEDPALVARIKNTIPLSKIDPDNYQVVHFAGGHGTMWDFPDNKDAQRIIRSIYEKGGIVAAVCHGPSVLVNVKLSDGKYLVDGKEVSGFTNNEEAAAGLTEIVPFSLENKLKERGAVFREGSLWQDEVSVSSVAGHHLITGQNPQSAASLAKKIVELSKTLKPELSATAKTRKKAAAPAP